MLTIKRILAAIEPWYHWGRCERGRLDSQCCHFTDESWGEVRRFELQWFGVHFAFEIGRTPRKLTQADVAARKSLLITRDAERARSDRARLEWRGAVEALAAAESIDFDAVEDRDAAVNEAARLFEVMLATPAPSIKAAAEKLRIVIDGVGPTDELRFGAIERDLRRLAEV